MFAFYSKYSIAQKRFYLNNKLHALKLSIICYVTKRFTAQTQRVTTISFEALTQNYLSPIKTTINLMFLKENSS